MVFVHALNPVAFSLGPFSIRWYGIIFALGFFLSYWYIARRVRAGKLHITQEDLDSFLLWLIIAVIGGARLGYALFYDRTLFTSLELFKLWHGGLSFHGGLAGALLTAHYFCKKKRISVLHFTDEWVTPAALALALGRIANFVNGELYGRATTVPWGVVFQGMEGARHPSQLYESAKNFFIFGILFWKRNAHWPIGLRTGIFLTLYGMLRFSIEYVRTPEITLGLFTMGQWLSLPVFVAGMYLLWKKVRIE